MCARTSVADAAHGGAGLARQAVRRLERELHTAQTTRGEASEELRATYEKQLKAYERFVSSMQRCVAEQSRAGCRASNGVNLRTKRHCVHQLLAGASAWAQAHVLGLRCLGPCCLGPCCWGL